jgi:hypothetical protein
MIKQEFNKLSKEQKESYILQLISNLSLQSCFGSEIHDLKEVLTTYSNGELNELYNQTSIMQTYLNKIRMTNIPVDFRVGIVKDIKDKEKIKFKLYGFEGTLKIPKALKFIELDNAVFRMLSNSSSKHYLLDASNIDHLTTDKVYMSIDGMQLYMNNIAFLPIIENRIILNEETYRVFESVLYYEYTHNNKQGQVLFAGNILNGFYEMQTELPLMISMVIEHSLLIKNKIDKNTRHIVKMCIEKLQDIYHLYNTTDEHYSDGTENSLTYIWYLTKYNKDDSLINSLQDLKDIYLFMVDEVISVQKILMNIYKNL